MDLTAAINGFLSTGGKITQCPNGDACWNEIFDPVIEFRTVESNNNLIYIGHDIELVSNEYKLPRRERE